MVGASAPFLVVALTLCFDFADFLIIGSRVRALCKLTVPLSTM